MYLHNTNRLSQQRKLLFNWLFFSCLIVANILLTSFELAAQSIQVRGPDGNGFSIDNYIIIANGDMTPSTADGTDAGQIAGQGSMFFYVFNTEDGTTLNVSNISVDNTTNFTYTGETPFAVTGVDPITSTSQGQFIAFDLTATTPGIKSTVVTITSDDPNQSTFTFTIQVEVVEKGTIKVLGLTDPSGLNEGDEFFPFTISNGGNPGAFIGTDFLDVKVNSDMRCSAFAIENEGIGELVFTNDPPVQIVGAAASEFTVAKSFRSTTLAGGGKDTIVICYDPNAVGLHEATVQIPNDGIENTDFEFDVLGSGTDDLMCDFIYDEGASRNLNFMWAAANGDNIWAVQQKSGGNDKRLFTSMDKGKTWTTPDRFGDNFSGTGIKYDATSNLLVAGSFFEGLYISTDGGTSFTLNNTVSGSAQDGFVIDGSTIYAHTARNSPTDKLHKSTDNGQTFTEMPNSPPGVEIIWADGSTIYVVNRITSSEYQLHRSTDSGDSFSQLTGFSASRRPQAIAVEGNRIVIGAFGEGIYISDDGGTTFTNQVNPGGISDDVEDVLLDGNAIYVVTQNNPNNNLPGFAYSYDGGTTWRTAVVGARTITIGNIIKVDDRVIIGAFAGISACACKELQLLGNNVEILDEYNVPTTSDHTDFGEVSKDQTFSRTFTLKSLFRDPIQLTGTPAVTIEGANAAQFSVTTQPTDTDLAENEMTDFTIQFTAPQTAGTYRAIVKIENTDYTEGTLTFNLKATVPDVSCPDLTAAAPAVQVTNSTCTEVGGTPAGGSFAAPATSCPTGSTLQYSTDNSTWGTDIPDYDQENAVTVYTRCNCNEDNNVSSPTAEVTSVPGQCPNQATGGTIGTAQTLCITSNDPAAFTSSVAGTAAYTLSYEWESSIDNNTFSSISNTNAATYDAPALTQTTYFRRKTISTNSNNNDVKTALSNTVVVTIVQLPTTANAGDDVDICGLNYELQGNIPTVGTPMWSVISSTVSGGQFDGDRERYGLLYADQANASFNLSQAFVAPSDQGGVIGFEQNQYTLRYTVSNAPCPVSTDEVTLNSTNADVFACPDMLDLCKTEIPLLGRAAEGFDVSWSIYQNPDGNISIMNPTNAEAVVRLDNLPVTQEEYILRWQVNSGACVGSHDDVVVTFSPDSDEDTFQDCKDLCVGGDDRVNTDGVGIPDDCDCNVNSTDNEFVEMDAAAIAQFLSDQNGATEPTRHADFQLKSNATIPNNGKHVFFKAGNNIVLEAGFTTEPGALFTATIEYCKDPNVTFDDQEVADRQLITSSATDVVNTATINLRVFPTIVRHEAVVIIDLPVASAVNLTAYDQNGRPVKVFLQNESREAGSHYFRMNTTDFTNGMYFLQLHDGQAVKVEKIVVQRQVLLVWYCT